MLDVTTDTTSSEVAVIAGSFDHHIAEITNLLHARGALVYLDGANMNAILGVTRPGDFGADMMHFNPHKTFSGPHGGGGRALQIRLVVDPRRSPRFEHGRSQARSVERPPAAHREAGVAVIQMAVVHAHSVRVRIFF